MEFRYRIKNRKAQNSEDAAESQSFVEATPTADANQRRSSSESENERRQANLLSTDMPPRSKRGNWKKDQGSIALLLFLYLLQGIPLGMAGAIPLILQTYGASWSQQATFSFASWPFSLKLLWAPLVDAIYCERFGRRKSWLIPIQYLIGFSMAALSFFINDIIMSTTKSSDSDPHIYFLTAIFFGLSFLAATQDICVDGWALSMLSKENLGWASTCNSVGQTAGFFLGYVVFLVLESKDFANRFIRQPLNMELQSTGLVTLPGFLLFWGVVFIISTTLVAIFKHETDDNRDSLEPHFGITDTYKLLIKVLRLPSMRSIAVILLTAKIGFAATDAMTALELIERGVSKESLVFLAIPLTPLQILLPFLISRYTAGAKPLNVYLSSYPFRLILGVVMAFFVFFTPSFQNLNKTFPWYFYASAVTIYGIHQVFLYSMFVSQMAFFAQVSDEKIGGTYMTLLNTLANLGASWSATAALYAAKYLTWKTCSSDQTRCPSIVEENKCAMSGGTCHASIDAYYIETGVCTAIGFLWLIWKYRPIVRLQNLPTAVWQVRSSRLRRRSEDDDNENPPLMLSA